MNYLKTKKTTAEKLLKLKMDEKFRMIEKVVADMGGIIEEFIPERDAFFINVLGKRMLFKRDIAITRQSFISAKLTTCKEITYKMLIGSGLPTPKTEAFYKKSFDKTHAIKKLNKLKYPVILKNAAGCSSRGIFPGVAEASEALRILKRELSRYSSMIAQEMVFGTEYKLLVLGEKVIGALEMIHPHIIGDGTSTIAKMIKWKQCTTDQRTKFDKKLAKTLKSQNVSLRSVLPKGKIIKFKRHSCLAEGGETRDVTDIIHKDVKDICVAASKAVGKYLVGIDVICKDISKKPTKKNFNILEVNGKSDWFIHYTPTHGKARNVLKDIIKFLAKVSVSPPASKK